MGLGERCSAILADLVALPSVNPHLEAGAAGEARVAAYVAEHCRRLGLEVMVEPVEGDRPNVLARRRGTGEGPTLLLNAHADTVGTAGMTVAPFTPQVKGGRLFGRGAMDMKAGLAAILAVLEELQPLPGQLLVGVSIDEEYRSVGTEALLRRLSGERIDGVILPEATDLCLHAAQKGFAWLEVEIHGRAAHGGRWDLGVDAIAHAGRLLREMEAMNVAFAADVARHHRLLGRPSVHASTIEGGSDWSTYPDRCLLTVERRTLPGEGLETALAEWQAACRRLAARDPAFHAEVRPVFSRDPFEVSEDAAVVRAVQAAATQVLGRPLPLAGRQGWIDAALFGAAGMPTAVFGPVGGGMHGAEEWVDLESLRQVAEILAAACARFCNR